MFQVLYQITLLGDQYCEEVTFEYLRNVANAEVIVNYTANGYVSQTKRDHIVENIAIVSPSFTFTK